MTMIISLFRERLSRVVSAYGERGCLRRGWPLWEAVLESKSLAEFAIAVTGDHVAQFLLTLAQQFPRNAKIAG